MSVDPAFPFLIAVIHNSKGSDNATIMQQFRVNYYELPARNTLNNTHETGRSGIIMEGVVWSITGCQPVYITRGLRQLVLQPSLGFS